MKRIQRSTSAHLSPVRLYLDDIEELLRIMPPGSSLELILDDSAFEGLSDFEENVALPSVTGLSMTFRSEEPRGWIAVSIKPGGTHVHGHADLPGETAQIINYLKSKTPWYALSPANALWTALGALLVWAAYTLAWFITMNAEGWWLLWGVGTFAVFYAAISDRVYLGGGLVRVTRSLEAISFWQRHRERIAVHVINTLISLLAGIVIGRFL